MGRKHQTIHLAVIGTLFWNGAAVLAIQAEPRRSYTEELEGSGISLEAAREVKGNSFVEIQFKPSTFELTDSAKASISSLLDQGARLGDIHEIMVLSWADHEYPSRDLRRLPRRQIALASARNSSIQSFLRSMQNVDVAKYNMAEQPNILSKWLETDDARLKDTLVAAGLPTTEDEIQYPSKASHAIIILKLKQPRPLIKGR